MSSSSIAIKWKYMMWIIYCIVRCVSQCSSVLFRFHRVLLTKRLRISQVCAFLVGLFQGKWQQFQLSLQCNRSVWNVSLSFGIFPSCARQLKWHFYTFNLSDHIEVKNSYKRLFFYKICFISKIYYVLISIYKSSFWTNKREKKNSRRNL